MAKIILVPAKETITPAEKWLVIKRIYDDRTETATAIICKLDEDGKYNFSSEQQSIDINYVADDGKAIQDVADLKDAVVEVK